MPGIGRASPSISVSTPGHDRSSVDNPETASGRERQFLAPGKKEQGDVLGVLFFAVQPCRPVHTVDKN